MIPTIVSIEVWWRNHILLLQRGFTDSFPGCWHLPGGKIEKDETPVGAACRELFEETGLSGRLRHLRDIESTWLSNRIISVFFYNRNTDHLDYPPQLMLETHFAGYGWFTREQALSLGVNTQ